MREEINAIVASTSDHPAHTGLAVGVVTGDIRFVLGYGEVDGAPPVGDTLYEIGSVTKVFTTALLSILADEGVVAVDEPVSNLATELVGFPSQITMLRLATHTAGLPKMPSNILGSMLRDRSNPYAAYKSDDLFQYLITHPPKVRQMEAQPVNYSNLGMALLGTLLARRLGDSYEAAIISRICKPLGLQDTCLHLTEAQKRHLAPPHNARGKRNRNWELPAFAGAGGLKSTVHDLLKFLAAHLGRSPSAQTASLQACHTVRARTFAPPGPIQSLVARISGHDLSHARMREGMALGWTVGRLPSSDIEVHWHHGATGGYRAFVGFIGEHHIGVVVLVNSGLPMRDGLLGITATDRIGFGVLELLANTN